MKSRGWLLVQLAGTALFVTLLLRQVPLGDSLAAMRRVAPATLVLTTLLALVGFVGRSVRWTMLLAHAGVRLAPLEAYRLTLLGVGYGLATPGRVGELARAAHVQGSRPGRAASVVWDRVADLLLLEAMSLPAFVFVPAWRGPWFVVYGVMVAATLALVFLADHPRVAATLARAVPPLGRVFSAWGEKGARTFLTPAFGISFLGGLFYYAFTYAGAWLVLRDLVEPAPPGIALAFPLIPLLGNLPIAFGGLGLREQVSATLFATFGLAAAAGPAFSLVLFATSTLVPGLLGLAWRAAGAWAGPAAPAPGGPR